MENNLLAKKRKRRRIEKVRKKICCIVDVDLIAKKAPTKMNCFLFPLYKHIVRHARENERCDMETYLGMKEIRRGSTKFAYRYLTDIHCLFYDFFPFSLCFRFDTCIICHSKKKKKMKITCM